MSNLLISKKGKVPGGMLVAGAIFIGIGVFILVSGLSKTGWRDSDFMALIKNALPFLFIIGGGAMMASAKGTYGRTYINLFNDRVEGIGISNGKALNFVFTQAQVYRILKQGSKICVFCNGVGFDICLSEDDAAQVYHCFMRGAASSEGNSDNAGAGNSDAQTAEPEKVIVACTHCGTKCRVLKGKGSIVIKCPRCLKEFNANS